MYTIDETELIPIGINDYIFALKHGDKEKQKGFKLISKYICV